MSHGPNKNEAKITASDKSELFKFKREPNQSKHRQESHKGGLLFVSGNVKTKKTPEDSDKVSNVPNETEEGESLFLCGNINTKKTQEDFNKVLNVSIRDAGGNLDTGK